MRGALFEEIFGKPLRETVMIYPPFYCDYGLNIEFGEQVFVNQGCWFLDIGGIQIGGNGSVVGAGTAVSNGVPTLSVVTGTRFVQRKQLDPLPS